MLFDIGMPGFDGYEVARRMRAELGLTATRVTKPVDIRKLEKLLTLPN